MDSLLAITQDSSVAFPSTGSSLQNNLGGASPKFSADLEVLQSLSPDQNLDSLHLDLGDPVKALTIGAQKILDKINALLSEKGQTPVTPDLPSLPTPETTTDHIISGVSLLFDRFSQQNPSLEGEDLINEFFKRARSGVESGYKDATSTLEQIGAFDQEGVRDQVSKTKSLLDEKLNAFENQKRKDLGLSPRTEVEAETKDLVKKEILESVKVNQSSQSSGVITPSSTRSTSSTALDLRA